MYELRHLGRTLTLLYGNTNRHPSCSLTTPNLHPSSSSLINDASPAFLDTAEFSTRKL